MRVRAWTAGSLAGLTALLLGCLLLLLAPAAQGLNVVVRASKETCFIEEMQQHDRMKISFVVIAGGSHDADMAVYGPEGDVVFQLERTHESNFQFNARTAGTYRICFNNKMSTISSKVISFNVYVGERLHHHESATGEAVNKVDSGVQMLQDNLFSVRDSTDYLRYRQIRCSQTAQSTNRRVFWWKVVHTLVLLGAAGLQVLYITRLFTQGKGLGGALSSAASSFASFGSSGMGGSSSMSGGGGGGGGGVGGSGGFGGYDYSSSATAASRSTGFLSDSQSGGGGGGGGGLHGRFGGNPGGVIGGGGDSSYEQQHSQRFSALGGNPFD